MFEFLHAISQQTAVAENPFAERKNGKNQPQEFNLLQMRTSCNDKGVDAQSKSNKSSKQKSSDPIEKKVAFVFLFYLLPQLPLLNLRLMQWS